jgi:hypothetical protein
MQISLEGKVAIVTGVSGDGQVGKPSPKRWQKTALSWRFVRARKATSKHVVRNCERQAPACSPWLGL